MYVGVCVLLTYVQHILLDDGVHYDGHQHVEEDSSQVFDTMMEVVHSQLLWAFSNTHRGHRVITWTRSYKHNSELYLDQI